jgi:hypothetical protein
VRVEQHGHAAPLELDEQVAHDPAPDRVERAGRLVEHQQAGRPHQRLRDAEPLLHALRHRLHAHPGRVGQAHQLEQLTALGGAAVRAGELLVQLEQLVGAQPAREAKQLGQVAERGARRGRSGGLARHARGALGGAHEAAGDLHQGRLARAVRAQQPDQLARQDLQVHPAQREGRPVPLAEPLTVEGGGHAAQCRKGVTAPRPPRCAPV